jgi:hypothetical protein
MAFVRQRYAETPRDTGKSVTSPAVAKRNGDGDHARPLASRHAIEVAHQLREEVVGIELLDDRLQECARPGELRGAGGKQPHRTRAKFVTPALGIVLLFGPGGFFKVAVEVDDRTTDLAHGCTSTKFRHARRSRSRADNCGGPGPPARLWV